MTLPAKSSGTVPDHFGPGCTCTTAGEMPECPDHGYEAVIWRLRVECDRYREALTAAVLTQFQGEDGQLAWQRAKALLGGRMP